MIIKIYLLLIGASDFVQVKSLLFFDLIVQKNVKDHKWQLSKNKVYLLLLFSC